MGAGSAAPEAGEAGGSDVTPPDGDERIEEEVEVETEEDGELKADKDE